MQKAPTSAQALSAKLRMAHSQTNMAYRKITDGICATNNALRRATDGICATNDALRSAALCYI
jgi:hypothetical protein